MVRKVIACILGAADLALLVIIIIAAATGWRIRPAVSTGQLLPPEDTSVPQQSPSASSPVTSVPPAASSTEPVSEPPVPESSVASKPESSAASRPESSVASRPESSVASKPESSAASNPSSPSVPGPGAVSTTDYPSLADITGFHYQKGWTNLSPHAVKLTQLSQVMGGWKAYMICDPENTRSSSMDKLFNLRIDLGQTNVVAIADWYYTFFNDTGEGMDDDTPDSTFSGDWSDGQLTAIGPGRITLRDFYYDNGRETAVGEMIWPDGVTAVIALVRP